ncbi:Polyketide synthase enoylreductase [Penicillium manginii]|uniref:Polyketide synthase enoylreductase n=1 Tax=Penicillium manginii TaxID=203109 RepID=UPI002549A07D|nr:Polyketide synthase enoylreductase [Penicillium manginii]KAJ5756200.1 Polyketide synthase enoylreductase [Penicillium manginii]
MGSCPIVVDTGEPKRTISMEMGAEAFVDFQESNAIEAVLKIADGVEHMACLLLLRLHIRACANYTGDGIGAVYIFENLTVKGTLVGSRSDTAVALDFARRGLLRRISEVYPINRLPEAVQK